MIYLYFVLGIPVVASIILGVVPHRPWSNKLNTVFSISSFISSMFMAVEVFDEGNLISQNGLFYLDSINTYLIVLTAFIGVTTSIFSGPYMAHEQVARSIPDRRMRLYHASFQGFILTMLLVLSTNNLGLLWVSMEGATLASVLLVSLYRTPESIEAAWKYFILCGAGLAMALFGTVLLDFASSNYLQSGGHSLQWNTLMQHADTLNPTAMSLAFVFLLVGYGTKLGMVPLHNWLPDAHSEGPTPMSAVLSGLLLNVALYAILRLKMLTDVALKGTEHENMTGILLMGFGLVSFIVAGLFIHRQKDIKRLFSYSSIEHMGLITFAFGLNVPLSVFGGLLHLLVHSLTKSAIFVTVGHASQIAGTQQLKSIRGLLKTNPSVAWGLMLGTAAIAGFPPFGVFTSEFLLLTATMQTDPWLTGLLLVGLSIAFSGLFKAIQPAIYGVKPENYTPVQVNMWPIYIHMGIVLWLGIAIPGFLSDWFDQATQLITGVGLL